MSNRNIKIEQGFLSLSTRKSFSKKIIDRLSSRESYMGKKYKICDIILMQARKVVDYILQTNLNYKSFSFKW
jgi:phage-related holin